MEIITETQRHGDSSLRVLNETRIPVQGDLICIGKLIQFYFAGIDNLTFDTILN